MQHGFLTLNATARDGGIRAPARAREDACGAGLEPEAFLLLAVLIRDRLK